LYEFSSSNKDQEEEEEEDKKKKDGDEMTTSTSDKKELEGWIVHDSCQMLDVPSGDCFQVETRLGENIKYKNLYI